MQPEICDGQQDQWNPNGGACTYGCDNASTECVCQAPTGRFIETTHAYYEPGVPSGVFYKAVKDILTGLVWLNEVVPTTTFGKALDFCMLSNGRLPSRAEVRAIQVEQYPAVTCSHHMPEPFKVVGPRLWTVDTEAGLPGTRYTVDTLTAKEVIKAEGDLAAFRCVHDPF